MNTNEQANGDKPKTEQDGTTALLRRIAEALEANKLIMADIRDAIMDAVYIPATKTRAAEAESPAEMARTALEIFRLCPSGAWFTRGDVMKRYDATDYGQSHKIDNRRFSKFLVALSADLSALIKQGDRGSSRYLKNPDATEASISEKMANTSFKWTAFSH